MSMPTYEQALKNKPQTDCYFLKIKILNLGCTDPVI